MALNAALKETLTTLFTNADIKDFEALISNLEAAENNQELLQQAWLPILQKLNPAYWCTRDNTKKYNMIVPVLFTLVYVAETCLVMFDGKVAENPALAEQIVQMQFKASQILSIASTSGANGPKNYIGCTNRLTRTGDFITNNGIVDSEVHAVWHNLQGGHLSRGFLMGEIQSPQHCVSHFQEAVRIRTRILGQRVEDPKHQDLRHALMCLANVFMQEAIHIVVTTGAVTPDVSEACINATAILEVLTDAVMVTKDGKPDLYRRADCQQTRAYVAILRGDFAAARSHIDAAIKLMTDSLDVTAATGQLSYIYGDANNIYVACAVANALKAIELSDGKIEQMYAEQARQQLEKTKDHKYDKLARIIVENPKAVDDLSPWESLSFFEEYAAFFRTAKAAQSKTAIAGAENAAIVAGAAGTPKRAVASEPNVFNVRFHSLEAFTNRVPSFAMVRGYLPEANRRNVGIVATALTAVAAQAARQYMQP